MKRKGKKLLVVLFGLSLIFISSCTRHFCSDEDAVEIVRNLAVLETGEVSPATEGIITRAEDAADKAAIDALVLAGITDPESQTYKDRYAEEYARAYDGNGWVLAEGYAKIALQAKGAKETDPNYQTLLEAETNVEFNKFLLKYIAGEKAEYKDEIGTLYVQSADYYLGADYPKACIAITEAEDPISGAVITGKNWGDAFKFGPVEGLLVYPIAWLIDFFAMVFGGTSIAAVFGLILVTILVRVLTLALTLKQTIQSQKIQAIQPEINAITAKYAGSKDPNAKNLQAQETMKIYQKYHVNPFSSLIMPFVTLPVFIAMWGAVNGVILLRTGTFLNLNLGDQLFANLGIGADAHFEIMAWILLIVMIGSQFVSMKLPMWLNKKKNQNKVVDAKTKQMQSSTNMMSNMMLVMIVGMGLFLPTAMSIYWTTSSLLMIIQQFFIQKFLLNKESL